MSRQGQEPRYVGTNWDKVKVEAKNPPFAPQGRRRVSTILVNRFVQMNENTPLSESRTSDFSKKERPIRVYVLHVQGKYCGQIAAVLGKRKGSVSEDLACIEDLTGEKIRVGNPYMGANAKPGLRKLLKKTRSARGQGQRADCLYGWHSCRVFFVVTAIDAGIRPDDLRLIVGHATVLHYYNPEELIAAEKMRAQLRRKRTTVLPPPPSAPATANTALLAATLQSILANTDLTPEARNAAILALTAETTHI